MAIHLPGFTLHRPIGQGGMGRIFLGTHDDSGLDVAVKLTAGEADRAAFAREVEAVAGLDHPRIVLVFDHGLVPEASPEHGIAAGAPWLAMELASGGTAADRRVTSFAALRELLLQVLDALAHAHARGVVHRDLKPANLLRCTARDLRPGLKLSDFGLAHALGSVGEVDLLRSGTLPYMAPEQIRGDHLAFGPWTDLYALGCMAWEMSTGLAPFEGPSKRAVAAGHLGQPLPPLRPRFGVPLR